MPKTFFFFKFLTNGKFSFYFFADRFEVKNPDLLGQCPNFFYNVLQNNWKCLWIGFYKVKKQNCCLENPGIDPGTSRMLSGRSAIWANPPGFLRLLRVFLIKAPWAFI